MKKYFITDAENLGLQASFVVRAKYSQGYLEKAKQDVTDAEFIRIGELYEILGTTDGNGYQLILSKFSAPWKKSLQTKFPNAKIELYKPQ